MGNKDILRLRELANKVKEIAELPIQETNKKLWTSVNDLNMIRPVIHVRDYPIYMIKYQDELTTTIEDEFLKKIELDLLIRLYEWNHLRCDRVVEPIVKCPVLYTDSGFGIEAFTGSQAGFIEGGEYNKAKHFEPQIIGEEDLKKIKTPVVEYDEKGTMHNYNMMREIFDGILEVKLFGRTHFRCNPLDDVFTWMGLQEGLYNLSLEPELVHHAVEMYIDASIDRIKQYERLGILSSNNGFENVGNNCIGYTEQIPTATASGIGAKIADIWGENSDQIMTGVSPAMTEEFAFEHEKKWAKMFKLYSYGCCERLDHKLDILTKNFPNLRKVSCSPFSNLESTMEQLGDRYVISFKTNSNYLVGPSPDYDYFKEEMTHALDLSRKYKVNLVFNMKTLISLNGDPTRLWKWCDLASDIISNY